MTETAAQYWDATGRVPDQFERFERRLRIIDHLADIIDRQAAVLAVIAEACREHGPRRAGRGWLK
jgi:hypothetical protein